MIVSQENEDYSRDTILNNIKITVESSIENISSTFKVT
jgi:hypothetical protein